MLLPVLTSRIPGGGRLVGLRAPTNSAPTAGFTVEAVGLNATVTDTSTDPDGDETITSRTMDWGDGGDVESLAGSGPWEHTYATVDTFTATLTVTDNGGLTDDFADDVTTVFIASSLDEVAAHADPMQALVDAGDSDGSLGIVKPDNLWIGNGAGPIVEIGGSGLDLAGSGVDFEQDASATIGLSEAAEFIDTTDKAANSSAALGPGSGSYLSVDIVEFGVQPSTHAYFKKFSTNSDPGMLAYVTSTVSSWRMVTASGAVTVSVSGTPSSGAVNVYLRDVATGELRLWTNDGDSGAGTAHVENANSANDFGLGNPGGSFGSFVGKFGLKAEWRGAKAEAMAANAATFRTNIKARLGI